MIILSYFNIIRKIVIGGMTLKISDIEGIKKSVKLNEPVVVTFGTLYEVETIVIKVATDEGVIGFGEACPFEPVTGENIETEMVCLDSLKQSLLDNDPRNIEELHTIMDNSIVGHTALKAGIDIALYDILGKSAGLPLYKLLGGNSNQVTTDITLSIDEPDKMAAEARKHVDAGFTQLKIKAGIDIENDKLALQAIQDAVGTEAHLKMDANQGWTTKQTISFLDQTQSSSLETIEQPLPYWDHTGNQAIKHSATQPLMLDETIHSPHDAIAALVNNEADMFNIKLMKSAGIWGAEGINRIAEAAGITCMIGCMAETTIGISAAAHFAAAHNNVKYCDLDSFMFFKQPDWLLDTGFKQDKELITLSDKPGLGIEINL